jgi:gamma-glutamylcyclotransferase (GGCT)/AIG2-like uncharacterized protein YtfP
MTSDREYLFVYGTLLRRAAHPQARYLAERAIYLGEVKIPGRLFNLGRFPGLIEPASPEDFVWGDLYDLGQDAAATLTVLDQYEHDESTPTALFERRLSEVTLADGSERTAWVYWFRGAVKAEQRIRSGRYL